MNITELNGKRVVVSARTITIKDETGKTRGMIRNVENLKDMQANKQIEYHGKLIRNGIERSLVMGNLRKILVVDKEMYFLCDDYTYGVSKMIDDGYAKMVDRLEASEPINVIHCERVQMSERR